MVKILVAAAILFAGYAPNLAQAHTDIALLRDVICEQHETVGEAYPDRAKGGDGERGRCQIIPATARWAGYEGSDYNLARSRINRHWALEILKFFQGIIGTDDVRRLAHAYNGGPYLAWEGYGQARRYADQINIKYQAAQRQAVAAQVFPWSRI